MPTLIVHDSRHRAAFARPVGRKGNSWRVVAKILEDLDYLGYKRVVLKSDQEPSIQALVRAIRDRWTGGVVIEEAPAYDPKANGAIERTVRSVKAAARTLKLALESRLGTKIPPDSCRHVVPD